MDYSSKLKSILIITYGREEELYSTLNDLTNYKESDLEILLLDNNVDNSRQEKIENIFRKSPINLKYYHDGNNYGVALGRNYIIEKAEGEILITLDDDVHIFDINDLIKKTERYFKENKEIGCLAFNIKNYYTKKALRHEIPHGNKKLDFTQNVETYYFIGAGHAIKKEVYKECGLYPSDLGKYGGEESDLSFRIIKKYEILYTSDIEIFHKVSPNGRMARSEENYFRYRNKLRIVQKYMPLKYKITNILIWSLYYLMKERKIVKIYRVLKENQMVEKKTITKKEIEKLLKLKARLIY